MADFPQCFPPMPWWSWRWHCKHVHHWVQVPFRKHPATNKLVAIRRPKRERAIDRLTRRSRQWNCNPQRRTPNKWQHSRAFAESSEGSAMFSPRTIPIRKRSKRVLVGRRELFIRGELTKQQTYIK